MESFETAAKAHEHFQVARRKALDDLYSERKAIDEQIKMVMAWGKPAGGPVESKKRGRPKKEALQNPLSVVR